MTHALRLMFDWGGGSLWPADAAARAAFDVGPLEDVLPLSPALRERIDTLSTRHDGALDWNDPAGPSPWDAAAFAAFDVDARALRDAIAVELGADFHIDYVPLGAAGD